jgi:hypothetical protein
MGFGPGSTTLAKHISEGGYPGQPTSLIPIIWRYWSAA